MIRSLSFRLRFAMAMLAMVAVLWSVVDLHQHESGLHNESSCSVCSIERALGSGFTLSTMLLAAVAILVTLLMPWLNHAAALGSQSLARMRAPPSLLLPTYIQ